MIRIFSLTLCALLLAVPHAHAAKKPNIILIMADDMGYECVRANGGTSYKTPHLDKLAANGMRFTHCYSQPICTPSRVQLMTGIYNQRNYVRFGLLHPKQTTFAQLLQSVGYKTCVVGKWQLLGGLNAPYHFGFDEYYLWQLTVRKSRYPNPTLEHNGKIISFTKGEYGPDIVSDHLLDFIRRNKSQPFFAYYPMILPHWPFEPTPDSKDWDPKAVGVLKGKGNKEYFKDMVAHTDKIVGKIVKKLHDLNIHKNTLILFTGDNGTAVGITSILNGKPYAGGKGKTTNGGTHVPFIAYQPGLVPANKVNNDLIDFSDFLPTILDLAGVKAPPSLKLDGRSFLPQLRGEKGNPRSFTHCWYARNGGKRGRQFVRNHQYKLYTTGEFYDLKTDPLEKVNLEFEAISESANDAHQALTKALNRYRNTRIMLPDPIKKKKPSAKKTRPKGKK